MRDALPEFREAVKLDPEYLNAWKELSDIGDKMYLPSKERESIEFAKLRLDPLRRHSSFRINSVTDLKQTWAALEDASKAATATSGDDISSDAVGGGSRQAQKN